MLHPTAQYGHVVRTALKSMSSHLRYSIENITLNQKKTATPFVTLLEKSSLGSPWLGKKPSCPGFGSWMPVILSKKLPKGQRISKSFPGREKCPAKSGNQASWHLTLNQGATEEFKVKSSRFKVQGSVGRESETHPALRR
jgi:hypothetical protein